MPGLRCCDEHHRLHYRSRSRSLYPLLPRSSQPASSIVSGSSTAPGYLRIRSDRRAGVRPKVDRSGPALHVGPTWHKGFCFAFYGARGQDTGPLHALGSSSCRRRPHSLDCRFDGSGWGRSSAPYRSPKVFHSRGVLRSRAGTILLSGTLWPIASFGSPGAHSLSLGTRATRPSPAKQWMLSPVTGPLSVRRTRLQQRSVPPHARRFRPGLLRRFQSRRVVPLARAP